MNITTQCPMQHVEGMCLISNMDDAQIQLCLCLSYTGGTATLIEIRIREYNGHRPISNMVNMYVKTATAAVLLVYQ